MTSSEHSQNYNSNSARMIGYGLGFTQAWIDELENQLWKNGKLDRETTNFLISRMKNNQKIMQKWWDVRYESHFSARDIERMLGQE